mgnify:CR=1 FL=1
MQSGVRNHLIFFNKKFNYRKKIGEKKCKYVETKQHTTKQPRVREETKYYLETKMKTEFFKIYGMQ